MGGCLSVYASILSIQIYIVTLIFADESRLELLFLLLLNNLLSLSLSQLIRA
jgi:hypothetical protein